MAKSALPIQYLQGVFTENFLGLDLLSFRVPFEVVNPRCKVQTDD